MIELQQKRNTNEYIHTDDYVIIKTFNTTGEHLAYIDKEDFEKVRQYTWTHVPLGYVRTNELLPNGSIKRILLHRLIMGLVDSDRKIYIDHIDGNPSNNRKYNLRIANNMENQRNAKISTANDSGYRGVTLRPKTNTWRATISLNKESIYLGEYKTKEEAIKVRQEAELKHYGDYSTLNRDKVIQENIDRIALESNNT